VNQFHGIAKLRQSNNPGWVIHLVMHTYSIIAVTFVFSVFGVRL
jgi:hypothetical protein